MKERWLIDHKRFSLRVGGGEVLGWQIVIKRHELTFWGYEDSPNNRDYMQFGSNGGFMLLGIMFSWRFYGKTYHKNKFSFNDTYYRYGLKWHKPARLSYKEYMEKYIVATG